MAEAGDVVRDEGGEEQGVEGSGGVGGDAEGDVVAGSRVPTH